MQVLELSSESHLTDHTVSFHSQNVMKVVFVLRKLVLTIRTGLEPGTAFYSVLNKVQKLCEFLARRLA